MTDVQGPWKNGGQVSSPEDMDEARLYMREKNRQ